MRRDGRRSARVVVTLLLVALTSGCAVKLAPGYDRSLVDGLAKANEDAMVLFASVSSSTPDGYAGRASAYNALIGKFDALRLQSQARPTPRPFVFQVFGIGADPRTAPKDLALLDAPTPKILQTVVDTLTRMRDTDRRHGLTAAVAQGFKNSYEISMDQVLTYEKALER